MYHSDITSQTNKQAQEISPNPFLKFSERKKKKSNFPNKILYNLGLATWCLQQGEAVAAVA